MLQSLWRVSTLLLIVFILSPLLKEAADFVMPDGPDYLPLAAFATALVIVALAEYAWDWSDRLLSASWVVYLLLVFVGFFLSPSAVNSQGMLCSGGIATALDRFCTVFADSWSVLQELREAVIRIASEDFAARFVRLLSVYAWLVIALVNVIVRISIRRAP